MRLLKIGVYYPVYLQRFYKEHPALALQDYSTQHEVLMEDCFGSSNFWTAALNGLGYETCDLVANAEPLQKMWAKEHGLKFDPLNWLFEITAAQVRDFQPDVLIVADYSTVTAQFLRHLRETCPFLRIVVGWCGAPFNDDSIFYECDIVLSCVPELVQHFQENGHRSRHLNHAFDARVLQKIDLTAPPKSEFIFLGSIVPSKHFHLEREKLLSRLLRETDLRIWSEHGSASTQSSVDVNAAVAGSGPARWSGRVSALPVLGAIARRASRFALAGSKDSSSFAASVDPNIKRCSQPPLFGLAMFQQLHDSRVALNTHIDISAVNASNMRLFEATGVGTCLLTDWKANLSELFELDTEVVAYRNADECVEKAEYLLGHETERQRIAAAGQRRVLREHTFAARAAQIDTIINEALASKY